MSKNPNSGNIILTELSSEAYRCPAQALIDRSPRRHLRSAEPSASILARGPGDAATSRFGRDGYDSRVPAPVLRYPTEACGRRCRSRRRTFVGR